MHAEMQATASNLPSGSSIGRSEPRVESLSASRVAAALQLALAVRRAARIAALDEPDSLARVA